MTYKEKMLVDETKLLVRFANESIPVELPGSCLAEFEPTSWFKTEVFGKLRGETVAVDRDSYERITER